MPRISGGTYLRSQDLTTKTSAAAQPLVATPESTRARAAPDTFASDLDFPILRRRWRAKESVCNHPDVANEDHDVQDTLSHQNVRVPNCAVGIAGSGQAGGGGEERRGRTAHTEKTAPGRRKRLHWGGGRAGDRPGHDASRDTPPLGAPHSGDEVSPPQRITPRLLEPKWPRSLLTSLLTYFSPETFFLHDKSF